MAFNDRVILDHLLQEQRSRIAPNTTDGEFFEIFTTEQILKNYDLSYEEIQFGLVGKGNDGGIDSIYTFVNGELAQDGTDFSYLRRDINIDLVVIQSKTSKGFSEEALNKLTSATNDLLNFENPLGDFRAIYNSELLQKINIFRNTYLSFAPRFPNLKISYYYAAKGDEPHANVVRKVKTLEEALLGIFSNSQFYFEFLGAHKLLDLARQTRIESLQLRVAETPISTGKIAFICLVNLYDYFSFVTDSNKDLRRGIFEANVRDYQGSVEVNKAIKDTLKNVNSEEDFWWLNNGITIVASEASLAGKILTVKAAQVVNGLQTSMEIYNYFRNASSTESSRSVLVRVIIPPNEDSRNSIIKATNSQTNIPPASLRATDRIQSDIEQFFETKGLYYDRRKNYHKNLGRPMDRIISIPYLAQAVMAIVLQEPNNSRGRPSSLIKNNDDYQRVFSAKYPIALYVECIQLMRVVDAFLRSDEVPDYISDNRSNVRFQLAMFASSMKARKSPISPKDISQYQISDIDFAYLKICLPHVWGILETLREAQGVDRDRIAKSNEFDEALKARIAQILLNEISLDTPETTT